MTEAAAPVATSPAARDRPALDGPGCDFLLKFLAAGETVSATKG